MGWVRCISYVLLLAFLCFFCSLGVSTDSLRPGDSVTPNRTLISAGGNFALGFFRPGNSSSSFLGIWYNTLNNSVIWVANRESPLPPQDSQPLFTLGHDGDLLLLDGVRNTIWSTNISGRGLAGNSSIAQLLDTGDLIVKQGDGRVWESFDGDSDALILGMKLKVNKKTGKRNLIRSWISSDDPRPGKFTWGMDPKGSPQFFIWKENSPYYRSNLYQDGFTYSRYFPTLGYSTYYSFAIENDEQYFTYGYADTSIQIRFILTPDGHIQTLLRQKMSDDNWLLRWQVPSTQCEFYARCGAFGSCDLIDSRLVCSCLKGFRPKSQKDWDKGNYGGGCVRRIELGCDENDRFMRLLRMKWPDHSTSLGNMTFKDCEMVCSRNCSCSAFAYANISTDSSVNCVNWFVDLVDLTHNYSAGLNGFGQDLYVRVHASELDGSCGNEHSAHKNKVRVAIIVVSSVSAFFLIAVLAYILNRKYFRRKGIQLIRATIVGKDDIELLQISLQRIIDATNNFDEANKLGEGGFGPVYKGYISEFGMVAIKRLSKKSSQGIEEFMNELKLIAKLQHTNLVSLLGCCTEDEEKILIYEYLAKRSLDKFLFDALEKQHLDWSTRAHIIEGIAQGILYLHKYSRLKVIHRDLKTSNILLDETMKPKISDFGMARIFGLDQTQANTNHVVGTYGYIPPEYVLRGQFSEKTDVFSFGVLLLEIISGEKNSDFFHQTQHSDTLLGWAWKNWKEGRPLEFVDPTIRESCDSLKIIRCIEVGLLCVQQIPTNRPTMSDAVVLLSNDPTAPIPSLKEPAFVSTSHSKSSDCNSKNEVTISILEPR